jgi:serine/threonine protein kinase
LLAGKSSAYDIRPSCSVSFHLNGACQWRYFSSCFYTTGNLEEFVLNHKYHIDDNKGTFREEKLSRRRRGNSQTNMDFLSVSTIWSLLLDISSGLEHLHFNGIVHRDLKPPNILLKFSTNNREGEIPTALISDFGECLEIFSDASLKKRTGSTGTLEFTAPELLRGNKKLYLTDS